MKEKNILLVKTKSRYGSFGRYIDEVAVAMRKLGCNVCVLDVYPAVYTRFKHLIE